MQQRLTLKPHCLQLWDLATYKVHEFLRPKVRSQFTLRHRNVFVIRRHLIQFVDQNSIKISEPSFGIKEKMVISEMLIVCWRCSYRSSTPTTTFSTGSAAAPAKTGPTSLLDLTGFYYWNGSTPVLDTRSPFFFFLWFLWWAVIPSKFSPVLLRRQAALRWKLAPTLTGTLHRRLLLLFSPHFETTI
jgi:hypothetical protein